MRRLLAMLCLGALLLGGCTWRPDTTISYNWAAVKLPSGETVSGEVQGWNGYSDGDMLQVTIDGVTYLTHSSNVVLVRRPK